MTDILPHVLARAHRGLCPTCGAPLELSDSGSETACGFCGQETSVAWRLRRIEPHVDDHRDVEPDEELGGVAGPWQALHGRFGECSCPGCGSGFAIDTHHAILRCEHCGIESKVEARLVPITSDDVELPRERTKADFHNQSRGRIEHAFDIQTEQLFWRLLNEPDDAARVSLARRFQSWSYVNRTAAHFLPRLLDQVARDHDAVAYAASDIVGKLLCHSDKSLVLPALQACLKAVRNNRAHPAVLGELALGPPICIKALLDAAQHAARRGDDAYAYDALSGVTTIFGRNFDAHDTMVEVVMYRLFHAQGPVLGWALTMLRGRFYNGVVVPWRRMLRIIDELAVERPMVIPACRANLYLGVADDDDEFVERLEIMASLESLLARAAATDVLYHPPSHDPALYARAVLQIEPLLDDPRTEGDAAVVLCDYLDEAPAARAAVTGVVACRGETLPDRLKRRYLILEPDTDLLEARPYQYPSEPRNEPGPDEQALLDAWDDLARRDWSDVETARANMRRLREEADQTSTSVFQREEPATIPVPDHLNRELQEQRRAAAREESSREHARITEHYSRRCEELMARIHDPSLSEEERMAAFKEISSAGADMQREMEAVTKRLERELNGEA